LERTAWHKAAKGDHVEVVEKLWDWTKELQLKPEEVLSSDRSGQTAWNMAEEGGYIDILEKL
jgi:hypothetical protein